MSTHLGNGAHRTLWRHPNYLWDQMAEDRLTASLIVDGHHLPPEVVKTMVRAKTPARCVLVSDESGLAGLPPGPIREQRLRIGDPGRRAIGDRRAGPVIGRRIGPDWGWRGQCDALCRSRPGDGH